MGEGLGKYKNESILDGGDGEQESTLHPYPHSIDIFKWSNNLVVEFKTSIQLHLNNRCNRTANGLDSFTTSRSL